LKGLKFPVSLALDSCRGLARIPSILIDGNAAAVPQSHLYASGKIDVPWIREKKLNFGPINPSKRTFRIKQFLIPSGNESIRIKLQDVIDSENLIFLKRPPKLNCVQFEVRTSEYAWVESLD
jgi:hypothetical protein